MNIRRLDIAMHDRGRGAVARLEGMKLLELSANLHGDARAAVRLHTAVACERLRQAATLYVLHGDIEITVPIAVVVNLDHPRIESAQPLLDRCAAALCLHGQP